MARELHEWVVAGALVESEAGLLLVRNQRPGGRSDWSTPGGVIDATDVDVLSGLAREVEEETGLRVAEWEGPVYEVHALAPDLGWRMRCEVHRAVRYEGELAVADPDGIVVEAAFLAAGDCVTRLAACARWVGEPLRDWLGERWGPAQWREYRYDVVGERLQDLDVRRTA